MASVAVSIDSVSKRFRLSSGKPRSVKERVIHPGRQKVEDFWALRDISFDIDEGETIGLLGHNGSGKSTLLKLVGGIMKPTTGMIRVRGRLASLLELGAGFHPELTGRENVYMNAAVLGLKRTDIDARFDDIVEFAELERFIDQQVKHYSSGMYVRLGFAVAVNVDPDVLLVDEVLAVGDETFQRKCLDRVHQFQDEGRTIVVVSHSADLMRRICTRVGVLDHGDLVALGPAGEAIRTFRERLHAEEVERRERLENRGLAGDDHTAHGFTQEERRSLEIRITSVEIDHPGRAVRPYLLPGEPLSVRVSYESQKRIEDVVFGIAVYDLADGRHLYGANTEMLGAPIPFVDGAGEVVFDIASVPLLDGTYPITLGIHSHDDGIVYDWSEQRHWFEVMNPEKTTGTVALPVKVKVTG